MPSIQKQISLIFNKKKQQIFVDYFTYQRIRTQVFNYPKKYQNNFTYYIDLDNNLYELFIKNPIIRINTVFFKEIAIKNRSFYHEFTTFERALI